MCLMKGTMMKEKETILQPLDEEQLHGVTRGCQLCEADYAEAKKLHALATNEHTLSEEALRNGDQQQANRHRLNAIAYNRQAAQYYEAITAREAE